jgi:hypothetical protein
MGDTPDGVGAHARYAVRSTTQHPLQRGESPGRGPVFVLIWLPAHLPQNRLLVTLRELFGLAVPMPLDQRVGRISVEPGDQMDQMGDRVATLLTRSSCCTLEAHTIGDGKQLVCSDHLSGWLTLGATEVFEVTAFIARDMAKRILLVARRGRLRGRRNVE